MFSLNRNAMNELDRGATHYAGPTPVSAVPALSSLVKSPVPRIWTPKQCASLQCDAGGATLRFPFRQDRTYMLEERGVISVRLPEPNSSLIERPFSEHRSKLQ
jgi:hypothetical protein